MWLILALVPLRDAEEFPPQVHRCSTHYKLRPCVKIKRNSKRLHPLRVSLFTTRWPFFLLRLTWFVIPRPRKVGGPLFFWNFPCGVVTKIFKAAALIGFKVKSSAVLYSKVTPERLTTFKWQILHRHDYKN